MITVRQAGPKAHQERAWISGMLEPLLMQAVHADVTSASPVGQTATLQLLAALCRP
jgi:hypothetical protein